MKKCFRARPARRHKSRFLRVAVGAALTGTVALGVLSAVRAVPASALGAKSQKGQTVQVQTALDSMAVDLQETNLGNLVADAVRQAAGTPIALVAGDEIEEYIVGPGPVPVSQIVKSLRYAQDPGDTIVVLDLTGAQLRRAFERALSRTPQPFDGFLQVSGLQVRYEAGTKPGRRLSLTGPDGAEIVPDKHYQVATTRPLATGGLGYFQVWDKKAIVRETPQTVAAGLTSFLAAHKIVNAVVEGRIAAR